MIYEMPAREFATGSEVRAASLEVRRRLLGCQPVSVKQLMLAAPATLEAAERTALPIVVSGYAPLDMLASPSWKFLLALAAVRNSVSICEIMGKSRAKPTCRARHDAIALIYSHGYRSLPQIGRLLGRDHTTILHSVRLSGAQPLPPREPMVFEASPEPPKAPAKRTALQKAVARAYKHQVPAASVAEAYGCSRQSVKVIASRMGITRRPKYKNDTAVVAAL